MVSRGFRPMGWVAAVGGAALGCYLVSLTVASERAELASLEREIIVAKREIRSLQTEVGTRGRMSQLEQWNAEVLALSAPTSSQYLSNEVMLARFDRREPTIADRAPVQLASATTAPKSEPTAREGDLAVTTKAVVAAPLVRHASLPVAAGAPQLEARVHRATILTGGLAGAIDAAARREEAGTDGRGR